MATNARRIAHFTVGGASFANGFDLEFSTILGHSQCLTFRLPDSDEVGSRTFDWPLVALYFAAVVVALMSHLVWPIVFVFYVLYSATQPLLERSYKSWHWLEHQAALWLEGDLHLRFEDINPISIRCGSARIIARGLTLSAIAMVAVDYGVYAIPAFMSTLAAVNFCRENQTYPATRQWVGRLVHAAAWPTIQLCLLLQRILFMRRPDRWQRMWAMRWAKAAAPIIANSLLRGGDPRIVVKFLPGTSR